jgi:site-specific DNA recombinase
MQNAVAYIRVSSQRQVEEGGSLDVQTKQVESYAAANGLTLVRVFREEGESAKTDQRPRLQDMLQFIRQKEHGVQVVIVPKIDRLARNVTDYTNLKLQLNRLGIRLESLGERIEDTPVGRFTETILASVAQFDNEIRAERSKGGMVEAVSLGRWVWQAPVGYRNVRHNGKGTIEPHPKNAPIIQRAFQQLAEGHQSVQAVREFLSQAGIKLSRNGMYKLVQNEVYIGKIHAFGRVSEAKPPFVPIIDEPTFHRARLNLRPTNLPQQYQLESADFPLRGTIQCSCGRLYTASWSMGEYGQRYGYYRCLTCKKKNYSMKGIDPRFQEFLAIYRGKKKCWESLKSKLVQFESSVNNQMEKDNVDAEARVAEIQSLRDAVVLKNAKGVIPDDLAMRQIQQLTEELAQAMSQKREVSKGNISELVDFAQEFFFKLHATWDGFTLRTKKDLLRFMFPEGVLFDPERGFRTSDNSLIELVRRTVSGELSSMVDPSAEFSNSLHEWIRTLHQIASQDRPQTLEPSNKSKTSNQNPS